MPEQPTSSSFDADLRAAQDLHLQGRLGEAEAAYAALLNRDFDHPGLLYLLGTLSLQQGRHGLAAHLLRAAVAQDPLRAEAHANLGTAYFRAQRHEEALRSYAQAHRLDPRHAGVLANLAALLVNEGVPERALEYAQAALALEPGCAPAHWNAALALLELARWPEGWREFEWGFATGDRLRRNYSAGQDTPDWDGAPGRTVVVQGEMGIGDEVLFASCLPDLVRVCRQVIFDCHPRLEPLFRRSFPGVTLHGTRKDEYIAWSAQLAIDARVAIGSLPGRFRLSAGDFPGQAYLRADPRRVDHYRARLAALPGGGPAVAVAWAGGTPTTRADLRTVPLALWSGLLAEPARFVSLQYTPDAAPQAAAQGIAHWQEAVDDLDEMAALIAACDVVISVCQSAVHLAGALGVPCWCLVPSKPAWRYGVSGESMPWYASVRLFRQGAGEAWAAVLGRVGVELSRLCGTWSGQGPLGAAAPRPCT
jgi:hypothetical protein